MKIECGDIKEAALGFENKMLENPNQLSVFHLDSSLNIASLTSSLISNNFFKWPFDLSDASWNYTTYLNTCQLIEAMVLYDKVLLPFPINNDDFLGSIIDAMNLQMTLGISWSDFQGIFAAPILKVNRFKKDKRYWGAGRSFFDLSKCEKISYYHDQEKIANHHGVSFLPDESALAKLYKNNIIQQNKKLSLLNPEHYNNLLKSNMFEVLNELNKLGKPINYRISPIAQRVLQLTGQSRNKIFIGEIILNERDRAKKFRSYLSEIKREFEEAKSIKKALKVQRKFTQIHNEFAQKNDQSQNKKLLIRDGLISTIPKDIFDGISLDDFSLKSIIDFLIKHPTKYLIDKIRKRNFVYLIDIREDYKKSNLCMNYFEKVFLVNPLELNEFSLVEDIRMGRAIIKKGKEE